MWEKAFQNSPKHSDDVGLPHKEASAPDVNPVTLCLSKFGMSRVQDGTDLHLLFQKCDQQDHRRHWTSVNFCCPTNAHELQDVLATPLRL